MRSNLYFLETGVDIRENIHLVLVCLPQDFYLRTTLFQLDRLVVHNLVLVRLRVVGVVNVLVCISIRRLHAFSLWRVIQRPSIHNRIDLPVLMDVV